MNRPEAKLPASQRAVPPAKWWGRYETDGNPPRPRFVVRWGRILSAALALVLTGYLSLMTALWGYYAIDRRIPGVNWLDVVVLPRFSRVQNAIGSHYFEQAKDLWKAKDYVRALFTARAAVGKAPANLDARLFLAGCWRAAGRPEEAVRVLRGGIAYNAGDARLQQTIVGTCLDTERYQDLLKALREEFPAYGVTLLDAGHPAFQLAELRALLEMGDAAGAEALASAEPGLQENPAAAPLLAQVDWDLGRHDAAFARLARARERDPADAGVQDSYVEFAFRTGRTAEAHSAARQFLDRNPTLVAAQVRFLEVFGSRKGSDLNLWVGVFMRFMAQNRHSADALAQLGTLAASEGWTDVAYLLYQNSLEERLNGFPFAIYYAGSLVKAGDLSAADEVWHELSIRNSAQLASASYIGAMVAWGNGRVSDALQIVDQLRTETASDLHRRRTIETLFHTFGFAAIADELAKQK